MKSHLKYVLVILFTFTGQFTIAQVSEGVPCETANGTYGTCINIKNCGTLLNLLITQSNKPEVRDLLRSSTCGYKGNTPLVCCPQAQPRDNPFETGESTTSQSTSNEKSKLPRPPDCGSSNITDPRVVNGVKAKLGEFPWMVALGYRNTKNPNLPKWLCGGALITKTHVLTAGHCVYGRRDLYLARVGELDLYDDKDGAEPQDILLVNAKLHENYSPVQFTNDIAILKLAHEPTIASVWPVCLPVEEPVLSKNFDSAALYVAGWGSLYFHGPTSPSLQLARLPVVKNNLCKERYINQSVIDGRVLCAGYQNGNQDACEGDSGGPLMYIRNIAEGKRILYEVGIVSYGFRCAEPGYPGVYTRITSFIEWIERNLD